jgi:nitrogen fixation protein FixH
MPATTPYKRKQVRELTGRAVLFWLIGFFGLVFAVNAVLVQAATWTFGGLETGSSYKAGLMFERELASARRQDALHWRIGGTLVRDASGQAVLNVTARNVQGTPLTELTAEARLAHPADARLDHVVPLSQTGAGQFRGQATVQPGQWELIVDLYRGGERQFRTRSRVTLQ